MSVPAYLSAAASQSSIPQDALKAALEVVLAGDDNTTVEGEQADALKKGFEYATELVKTLKAEPGTDDQLKLYAYFKQARNETPAKPSYLQFTSKYKYEAWEKINHISIARAQALYIQKVNELIESIGTN